MINKKEHILALKISLVLLMIGFFLVPVYSKIVSYFLYIFGINMHVKKYIIFIFVSIFLYFISLYFAKKTFQPIKEANKKLKEYNYNLAHELKTPLSIVKSDLELLEIGNKVDFEFIKSMKEEINSMQSIIDSLLFLAENNNLIKENIELREFILNFIEKNYDSNLFEIDIQKSKEIYVSKKLFEILLKNLIDNAVKYGDLEEKILIILDKNIFSILNKIKTDINIDQNKLFDTFYKADNSRNSEGYGLGLNIVKKIVELHNYNIKVEIKDNFFIISIIF